MYPALTDISATDDKQTRTWSEEMSVVRWGVEGSDVYIYQDDKGGHTCCGCDGAEGLSDEEMLKHLRHVHLVAGHTVPDWVIEAFGGFVGKPSCPIDIAPEDYWAWFRQEPDTK
jgi:hypothetical protein